jgi:hypothetical protein
MSHLRPLQESSGVLRRQANQTGNVGAARPFPGALYQPSSQRLGQDHAEPPGTTYRRANSARSRVGNFPTHLDRHARSRFPHVRVSSQHSAPAIVVDQAEGASTRPGGDKSPWDRLFHPRRSFRLRRQRPADRTGPLESADGPNDTGEERSHRRCHTQMTASHHHRQSRRTQRLSCQGDGSCPGRLSAEAAPQAGTRRSGSILRSPVPVSPVARRTSPPADAR